MNHRMTVAAIWPCPFVVQFNACKSHPRSPPHPGPADGLGGARVCATSTRPTTNSRLRVQFTLDRPIDAVAAPFVMAQVNGLFAGEGLAVTIGAATSSQDAIARVTSGGSDLALVDINALVRHRDKEKADSPHARAVFMLFNRAAYAIIARKSRGIQSLAELDGKSLGVVEGDPAAKFWPAVARLNGIKLSGVKQSVISAAVREPMLSAGQVDAVTGFVLSLGDQSARPRRAGRRPRAAEVLRLWQRGLWLCRHRQSRLRRGEAGGGEGFCARCHRRPASERQGAGARHRAGGRPGWTAAPATSNSSGCARSCATTS